MWGDLAPGQRVLFWKMLHNIYTNLKSIETLCENLQHLLIQELC